METPFSALGDKVWHGGLALAGFLLGVAIFFAGYWAVRLCEAALALDIIVLFVGRAQFRVDPVRGRWLIEAWAVSAVLVAALAATVIVWDVLNIKLAAVLAPQKLDKEETKQITELVVGAVAAFIELVLTKDIAEGSGVFFVPTQFQNALKAAGAALSPQPPGSGPVYQAFYEPFVDGLGDIGWGFGARGHRARIIARYLTSRRRP